MSDDNIVILVLIGCITFYNIIKVIFKEKNKSVDIQIEIDELYDELKEENTKSQPNVDYISNLKDQIEYKKTLLQDKK